MKRIAKLFLTMALTFVFVNVLNAQGTCNMTTDKENNASCEDNLDIGSDGSVIVTGAFCKPESLNEWGLYDCMILQTPI